MQTHQYKEYQIKYLDTGQGEQTILFLHNGGLNHRLWDYQIAHFRKNYRVIAPDLLGYGSSDRPDILYTGEDYVEQVSSLLRHLGVENLHIVGCCLGGAIAWTYALQFPSKVKSLSVITAATPQTIASGLLGPLDAVSPPEGYLRKIMVQLVENSWGRKVMTELFFRYQCGAQALKDTQFKEMVAQLYKRPQHWRVFAQTDYAAFQRLEEGNKPLNFPPFLFIWGEKNPILRAKAGKNLAKQWQPDRCEFWEDNGYMAMRESPERTNSVIETFISQTPALKKPYCSSL